MLALKNISKSYQTGDFTQTALNGVDLEFRENEFVAVLGPSGSGKTTLLNIIGGLDRYDSGDLVINGKSTKTFRDVEWDAYRNNSVGFVFQSYNLIPICRLFIMSRWDDDKRRFRERTKEKSFGSIGSGRFKRPCP